MRKYCSILIGCLLFILLCGDLNAQSPPTPRDTTTPGPQTFAMIMGISNYKYIKPLTYADKDAVMFRDFLKSPAGGKVKDDNLFMLLNEQAVSAIFWGKGFQWLKAKRLQKGDRLFIYLAGHGDAIDEDQFFYITYDCNPAGDKNNYLVGGTIQLFNLKKKIATETAKGVEVYFIMDACRSGELPGGTEGQNFLNAAISEKRAGEVIMLATGAGQESLEDASIGTGHGLFTYYLVDGLNGVADEEGEKNNQVTLAEIQKYVDKHVPTIAQQKFKRKQEPYFCCNENSDKVVTIVDTAYLKKWMQNRKKGPGNSFQGGFGTRGLYRNKADTLVLQAYNLFNDAVKQSKLTGKASAEYYYQMMEKKFPGNSYTLDAQTTLAVEFINFAQSKINLYLDCKDAAAIQRIRTQMDETDKTEESTQGLDRMEKVAQLEFFEVGNMLEKAINIIKEDDPDFASTLTGRMYFFKARGYYGKDRRFMDINKAFQYAYTAYGADKNAAYILNTLASLHFDNNRTDSAIIYAKRAISSAPNWRYPYVTLAYAYKSMGRVDSALTYYRKSIQIDPNNADAYVDLGHYYYSLSRSDSAISYYQKALAIEPDNAYASNNIGWLYYERKEYDKAIEYFKRGINADAKIVSSYNGISKAFVSLKQYDSARIYYSKAFNNYQDKSFVNIYIGNLYRDLKLYDSAKVYYRQAIEEDPTYEDGWNNLGKVSFEAKQYDSARVFYRSALQVNPYSAYSLINMGMVFKELKQYDSTYFYFQQAIRMEPRNAAILNNLGVVYVQDNKYDSAKVYFKRALAVKPDYRNAYNNLMKVYRDLGQLDSVTNYLKTLPQFDPESISTMNDLGLIFMGQKRYDSARAYYRRALSRDPMNAQLYNNMALVLKEMKLPDSAVVYLQRSLQLDPENTTAMLNLANVFKQLRMLDSAGYYYQKQLYRRAPDMEQAWINIGYFYLEMRAYDSAIIYFKKILANNPNHLPSLNNVGNAYMNLEKSDSAFAYYRKAVELNPSYPNASLNLGLLYHSLRQYDSAVVHIQNAIRLNPANGRTYYRLACSYALGSKHDLAIQNLKLAFEKGFKSYDVLITDPDLAGLKDEKEFVALLDKYIPGWKNR